MNLGILSQEAYMEKTYRPWSTVMLLGHWGNLLTAVLLVLLFLPDVADGRIVQNMPVGFKIFLGFFGGWVLLWSFLIHFRVGITVDRRSLRFVLEGQDFGESAARANKIPLGFLCNLRERKIDFDSLQAYGFRLPSPSGNRVSTPLCEFFFVRETSGTEWTFDLRSFSGAQRDDLMETLRRSIGFPCDPASTRKPKGRIYSKTRDFWTRFPILWLALCIEFFIVLEAMKSLLEITVDPSSSYTVHSLLPFIAIPGSGIAFFSLIILSDLPGSVSKGGIWKKAGIALLGFSVLTWIVAGLLVLGVI